MRAQLALRRYTTEKEFQTQVVLTGEFFGWRQYHPWISIRSASGWPDLFLLRPQRGQRLALELKSPRGRVSAAQQEWIEALNACGILAVAVWPCDIDWVEELLRCGPTVSAG